MGIRTWKIFDTFESDLELEFGGELCWVVQHAHVENVNLGHSHSGILALPETLHLSLKNCTRSSEITCTNDLQMCFTNDFMNF